MNKVQKGLAYVFSLLALVFTLETPFAAPSHEESVAQQLVEIMEHGEFDNSGLVPNVALLEDEGSDPASPDLFTPFIIGGTNAPRNAYPEYTLVILTDGRGNVTGLCGGTVIASDKIMTAAHCAQQRASTYFVIPGFYSFDDRLTANDFIQARSVVDHPSYRSQSLDFDVAVISLSRRVSITPAKVVSGNNQFVGRKATAIGTGLVATSPSPQTVPVLQQVTTPITSNSRCGASYIELAGVNPITPNMLCAGFRSNGDGTCSGDSGGPLFVNIGGKRAIAGTTSFGFQRCEANRATSAYARMTAFTDFIRSQSPQTKFIESNGGIPLAPIYSLLLDGNVSNDPDELGTPEPPLPNLSEGSFVARIESEQNENVGRGLSYSYNPLNSNIQISKTGDDTIEILLTGYGVDDRKTSLHSWSWQLSSIVSGTLKPGVFRNAIAHGASASNFRNTLYVKRNDTSCNSLVGEFTIYELEYSGDTVTKLIADFEQHCEANLPRLKGSIHYDTSSPAISFSYPPVTDTNPTPPINKPVFSSGSAEISGETGDPISKGLNYSYNHENSTIGIINETFIDGETSVGGFRIIIRGLYNNWLVSLAKAGLDADINQGSGRMSEGIYDNAVSSTSGTPTPYLRIGTNNNIGSDCTGRAQIFGITYNAQGEVETLIADFIQTCRGATGSLRMSVNIDRTLPPTPSLIPEPINTTLTPALPALTHKGFSLKLDSAPGEFALQGEDQSFDSFNANATVRKTDSNGVEIRINSSRRIWNIDIESGPLYAGGQLSRGIYRNVNSSPISVAPRLALNPVGKTCFHTDSILRIYEIEYEADGSINKITFDFEVFCFGFNQTESTSTEPLRGSFIYDATLPDADFVREIPTGDTVPPLPNSMVDSVLLIDSQIGDRLSNGEDINYDTNFRVASGNNFVSIFVRPNANAPSTRPGI